MEAGARRLSAIMFTDMVGYVALAQRNEPEALRLLEEHRAAVRPVLRRFRGTEVKTLGDGFLVEFASALDATACGVELQRVLHERNEANPASRVELRIGIHVGDVVHRGGDVYGDTVNIASRLQSLAEPGGVFLSGTVRDQVRDRLPAEMVRVGTAGLKNVELPVEVYRVVFPWAEEFRSRPTPLVDRAREVGELCGFVDRVARGEGALLLVVGEAGLGKSRLIGEMAAHARRVGVRCVEGRCDEPEGGSPYAPWTDVLRGLVEELPAKTLLNLLGPHRAEVGKLVPELAEKAPSSELPAPDAAQDLLRFLDGIAGFFRDLARERPTVIVLEDLAWADPASVQVLQHIVRNLRHAPLGVVGAVRASGLSDNSALAHLVSRHRRSPALTLLRLERFDAEGAQRMIEAVLGDTKGISEEFLSLVHATTGGNPYFIEEVLRALQKDGVITRTGGGWVRRPIGEITLPATVRDVLRERLDRLDPETRDRLRSAAAIGVEFDLDLLCRLTGDEPSHLLPVLERAMRASLLREERRAPRAPVYLFPDRPVRDALYGELSLARRRHLHRAIGEALERAPPGAPRTPAAVLAHHFLRGDEPVRALRYAEEAGADASAVHAHEAAAGQYRNAVDLLEGSPDEGRRCRALIALGDALAALARYGEAIDQWRSAIACGGAAEDTALTLRTYRRVLEALWAEDEADAFLRTYREAREVIRRVPDEPEGVLLDAEAAGFLSWLGIGREEALAARDRALSAARAAALPAAEATAMLSALSLLSLSSKEAALGLARESVRLAEAPRPPPVTRAGNDLFFGATRVLGTFGDAWEAMLEREEGAIRRAREARLFEWEAFNRAAAASSCLGHGRIRDGRGQIREMLRILARFDLAMRAREFTVVAAGQVLDGEFDAAEATLTRGIQYLEPRAPQHRSLIRFYSNLAECRLGRGKADDALSAALRALDLLRLHDYPIDQAMCIALTIERGTQAAIAAGRLSHAREIVEEGRRLAEPLGEPAFTAFVDQARGRLALAEGRLDEAVDRSRAAVATWERLDARLDLAKALRLLSEVEARLGHASDAARLGERSRALLKEMEIPALPSEPGPGEGAAAAPVPAAPAA